jgi:hypothetical protein
MRIKKTITDKVIAASQHNGKEGKGPNDPTVVGQNARKHGLSAKYLVFQNEEERQEFDALLGELLEEYQPVDRTDKELVGKVAVAFWNSAELDGGGMQELAQRRKAAAAVLRTLAENYDGDQLPLFTQRDGSDSAVQLGWDCQELVVRTGTRNSEQEDEASPKNRDRKGKVGHVQIEARLNTSLDTILRYRAAINRDLYRAIAELRSRQRERAGTALPETTDVKSIVSDSFKLRRRLT